MLTLGACGGGRRRHVTPTVCQISRFHSLVFGINELRWGEMPHFCAETRCSGFWVAQYDVPDQENFVLNDLETHSKRYRLECTL
jgi:hypothetical protein